MSSPHVARTNNDRTVHPKCELPHEVLNKQSVRTQILHAGTPKLTTLRRLLTLAAIHGSPVAVGDSQSAFHQSPMPSDSEPVYVEHVLEANVPHSKVWLCKKAFQGLNISPQAWKIHSTEKLKQ